MHSLLTALPAIIVLLVFLLTEFRRPEPENARSGRLPIMLLLVVLLSAGCVLPYFLPGYFVSYIVSPFGKVMGTALILTVMAVDAYFVLLLVRGLARLLHLTKKDRLISLSVMLVLFPAAIILFWVYLTGGF